MAPTYLTLLAAALRLCTSETVRFGFLPAATHVPLDVRICRRADGSFEWSVAFTRRALRLVRVGDSTWAIVAHMEQGDVLRMRVGPPPWLTGAAYQLDDRDVACIPRDLTAEDYVVTAFMCLQDESGAWKPFHDVT